MVVSDDEISKSPSSTAKNLGVILDCHFKLGKYSNAKCKSPLMNLLQLQFMLLLLIN